MILQDKQDDLKEIVSHTSKHRNRMTKEQLGEIVQLRDKHNMTFDEIGKKFGGFSKSAIYTAYQKLKSNSESSTEENITTPNSPQSDSACTDVNPLSENLTGNDIGKKLSAILDCVNKQSEMQSAYLQLIQKVGELELQITQLHDKIAKQDAELKKYKDKEIYQKKAGRPNQMTNELKQKVMQMRVNGDSFNTIAKAVGLSYGSIQKVFANSNWRDEVDFSMQINLSGELTKANLDN